MNLLSLFRKRRPPPLAPGAFAPHASGTGQPQFFAVRPPVKTSLVLSTEDLMRLLAIAHLTASGSIVMTVESLPSFVPEGWYISAESVWREIERLAGGRDRSFQIAGMDPHPKKWNAMKGVWERI